jgi:hypothetical protein
LIPQKPNLYKNPQSYFDKMMYWSYPHPIFYTPKGHREEFNKSISCGCIVDSVDILAADLEKQRYVGRIKSFDFHEQCESTDLWRAHLDESGELKIEDISRGCLEPSERLCSGLAKVDEDLKRYVRKAIENYQEAMLAAKR